jgi:mono/diheme cytochrome c family protein
MLASVLVAVLLLLPRPAAADADGKAVFEKNCTSCHGPDGKGATPAGKALKVMDLATKQWASSEAIPQIEKAVREGVPRMPAMGSKLKPEEIAAVARYTQEMVAAGNPQQ